MLDLAEIDEIDDAPLELEIIAEEVYVKDDEVAAEDDEPRLSVEDEAGFIIGLLLPVWDEYGELPIVALEAASDDDASRVVMEG